MSFLGKIFTWWNGATVGTSLFTWRNGKRVGTDVHGNVYYQAKKGNRRWVIYNGSNDGSRTPPAWQSWLRGQIGDVPDKALPPRRPFEKQAVPNLTGTGETYRPSGSLSRGAQRPAATGDYQAWTSE